MTTCWTRHRNPLHGVESSSPCFILLGFGYSLNPLHGVERWKPQPNPFHVPQHRESITWSWKVISTILGGFSIAIIESITWSWKREDERVFKCFALLPYAGIHYMELKGTDLTAWGSLLCPLVWIHYMELKDRLAHSTTPPKPLWIHYMELKDNIGLVFLRLWWFGESITWSWKKSTS